MKQNDLFELGVIEFHLDSIVLSPLRIELIYSTRVNSKKNSSFDQQKPSRFALLRTIFISGNWTALSLFKCPHYFSFCELQVS